MSIGSKSLVKEFVNRNKVLSAGLIVLALASILIASSQRTLEVMSECNNPRGVFPPGRGMFVPGSSFSMTCNYQQDIGQDLIFWATILEGPNSISIPSHVEIRNPDGNLIISESYNSTTIIVYAEPEIYGVYNATITNLESFDTTHTPGSRIFVRYAFGHLTSTPFGGVENPVGDALSTMAYWGYVLILPSLILIGYGIIRSAYRNIRKMG